MIKRKLALILVVLMSINSFGAVVSDNDGSAFITKAEFDSLKNDFQNQIDQYNTSIDSKIDGAIAAYLAGIKVLTTQDIALSESILTYPVTIYNDEYDWTFEKWKAQTPTTKWWYLNTKNNYFFLEDWPNNYYYTGASIQLPQFIWSTHTENMLKDFYVIKDIDRSSGLGRITGRRKNIDVIRNGSGILYLPTRDFYATQPGFGAAVRRDQLKPTYVAGGGGVGAIIEFTDLEATGSNLYRSDDPTQWIPLQSYLTVAYSEGIFYDDFSKLKKVNATGIYNYADNKPECLRGMQTDTISINYEQVDGFSNLWTGVNKNLFLPVLWDGVLYWTNSQSLKCNVVEDLPDTEILTYVYQAGDILYTGPGRDSSELYADIDAGDVLELEGYQLNEDHEWYNCALAKGSHFYYNVTVPNKNQTRRVGLCDGILLTDIPSGKAINSTGIELNLDFEYLMVSKNPIEKYTTTAAVASDRLLTIYGNENCEGTGYTLYPLREGTNKVYLQDFAAGDDVYIKIVWDNANTTYTRIVEKPAVSVTVE